MKPINSECKTYFHYVIKAACLLFGEEETRKTLNEFLLARWSLEKEDPK